VQVPCVSAAAGLAGSTCSRRKLVAAAHVHHSPSVRPALSEFSSPHPATLVLQLPSAIAQNGSWHTRQNAASRYSRHDAIVSSALQLATESESAARSTGEQNLCAPKLAAPVHTYSP